jgi:hypothetical protein
VNRRTPRYRHLILALVCIILALLVLACAISHAEAASSPAGQPPYRYCFDVFTNRPAVCVTVPNRAGRWVDCKLFKSCRPRVGG